MTDTDRLRLLIVCPQCDGEDLGESWCGYQWVSRLAELCDITLLTLRFPGHTPPSDQLKNVLVIEWDAFPYFSFFPRFNSTFKPWYLLFYWRVKAWLKRELRNGSKFDLVHHLTPMAMRFPSPCAGVSLPYVIGPVSGSLPTPPGFKGVLGTEPMFTRLRNFDGFRLRNDPWMRRTYQCADLVICSGPYSAKCLDPLGIKSIAIESEVGISELELYRGASNRQPGSLRMLHVARTVRTKGLRDAIRALAKLRDLPNLTLDIAGDGEDLSSCREEAERLEISDRVHFFGNQSRDEVEQLYREADLFLFPSFREPTGIVLFEAMRHGLPVITTDIGGPGYIVTDSCGIRVPAIDPKQLAEDLALAIRRLAEDPELLKTLGTGARARVEEIGLWDRKIERILEFYSKILHAN